MVVHEPGPSREDGGNSGIGRATAFALAGLGARVLVSGRDETRGDQVVREIRAAGGRAEFLPADLRDEASARSLAARARSLAGHVDVLVNNAGAFPFGPTHETTEADFDGVFTVNVKAPYFLAAELGPEMAKRGRMGLYGASKAALVLLTKPWAAECGPQGVRVNAVSPGPTRT